MSQTVVLPASQVNKILRTLLDLKRDVAVLTEKVENLEPIYGSDEWWEWSDTKALESIRKGEGTTVHNQKELQTFLTSLKTA